MGYICTVVYAIIPTVELTEEMLNHVRKDFNVIGSVAENSLRKNKEGNEVVVMFKKSSAPSVFLEYRWFSKEEILKEMENQEWLTE